MQELGLGRVYVEQDAVHKYCRHIMSLPILPQDRIVDEFERIEARANSASMIQLTSCVRKTWIDKTIWPPSSWSCFGQSIRTNDCESWHSRLNRTTGRSLGFYRLTERLSHEAKLFAVNVRLLSEEKVLRFHNINVRVNQKLHVMWAEYMSGQRTSTQLLKACARLYQPAGAIS